MTEITTDSETWDCIEDYSSHKNYIFTANEHNFRCELQKQENGIWGQLYDVTNSSVVAKEIVYTDDDWDLERIESWTIENLTDYFTDDEE